MKLPAPVVQTWRDLQLNFDAIVKTFVTRAAGPSGLITRTTVGAAAFTGGPSVTCPAAGSYLVRYGCLIQSNVGGLFQGNLQVAKNGTPLGAAAAYIGSNVFDGGTVMAEETLTLAKGDVLTLSVNNNNATSTNYSLGTISITPIL